jgi:DNA-binding protein Fis
MALTVKIRADASHFKKTIAGIEVQASGLTGVMGKLATSQAAFGAALAAAAAGAVALGAGLAFIKDASGKAAGMESLQVQFEVLTKSASKATELIKSFRDEAIKSLQQYAFPGNVRELENILERATALCSGDVIEADDLHLEPEDMGGVESAGRGSETLDDYLNRIERQAILEALQKTDGNRTAAARLLGVTFRSMRYRLERLGIE